MQKQKNKRPFLITMDLEIASDHDDYDHAEKLDMLFDVFRNSCLKITLFTTAEAAERYTCIRKYATDGHDIGSHGVHHAKSENYTMFSYEKSVEYLNTATDSITAVTGIRPVHFRGPSMTTSSATQNALIDLGYDTDFSVCSRRADIFNSRGGNLGWYRAPAKPYHPNVKSPFLKGNLPLWVIPLSSLGMPFMSGTLYLLGTLLLSVMLKILVKETDDHTSPIVFLFHSYEFAEPLKKQSNPIHRLYIKNRNQRFTMFQRFVKKLANSNSLECITASRLMNLLNKGDSNNVEY